MNLEQLLAQKQAHLQDAQKAISEGRLPDAQTARKAAEDVQAKIEEYNKIAAMVADSQKANGLTSFTLPGTNGGSMPGVATSNGDANKSTAQSATSNKASYYYSLRFQNTADAVKGILTDLYQQDWGGNYEMAYWAHKAAFTKYLRHDQASLTNDERKVLKTIVLTPDVVKSALNQGFDSVSALKTTMVEGIDTLGGFTVPVDFQARIIERIQAQAIFRKYAMQNSTSKDMVEIPTVTGGDTQYTSAVRVTWVKEVPTAGASATNLTFGSEQIPIYTCMAETMISNNMLEDAMFDVESYLNRKIAEAAAIDEDNQFLTGNGIGKPQGILPGGGNLVGITEKNSGNSSALTWDGLVGLYYAIPSQYRANARWIASRGTYEAIAKLKDSSGQYLWTPFQFVGGANGNPAKLLGNETLEQETMPSVGAGTYPVLFGDLGGYEIYDRVGMTIRRYNDFSTDRVNSTAFVMRRRLGAQLTEKWRWAVQLVGA